MATKSGAGRRAGGKEGGGDTDAWRPASATGATIGRAPWLRQASLPRPASPTAGFCEETS
jgi:hypothetical protein